MILKPATPRRFVICVKWASAGALSWYPAGFSEVVVSSEAFYQVFDVWYLFELSDHEGP